MKTSRRWYQVAARYHQGKLELWVNQNRVETLASGDIQYQWTANQAGNDDPDAIHDLEIGGAFEGNIDNLKWYNWSSSPLITFETGETQKTVSLNSAAEQLIIKSTGQMHELGGNLGVHRVAVHTDKVHQYASLMSLDTFTVIAGMSSESTPLSQQTVALPLSFLFPQAHAYPGESLVNWFFPAQELKAIIQQLTYAVTDPEKFEGDVLIVNLIIAVTYFPPGRVLQPFAKTLGVVFKTLKAINPKFMKYFAGMFKGVMSRAKKGDFDTLWNMLPFFMIVAEMYEDEEAREGLKFLFETVDSGEDVLSWVDYLALPSEGWDGDGEIPEFSMLYQDSESDLPLSWMMNKAYAQKVNVKRILGRSFGKTLTEITRLVSLKDAKNLPEALRVIKEAMTGPGAKEIAGHLFKVGTLTASIKIITKSGANSLKNFAKGRSNSRYPFPLVAATIGYLGWEMTCGELIGKEDQESKDLNEKLECDNKGFNPQVSDAIGKKLRVLFVDAATNKLTEEIPGNDDNEKSDILAGGLTGGGHGALFHLVQTAIYQLKYRYASGKPVKFLEMQRLVAVVAEDGKLKSLDIPLNRWCKQNEECIEIKQRNVDIILGDGKVSQRTTGRFKGYYAEDDADKAEVWVELKSWEGLPTDRETFANELQYGKKVHWIVGGPKAQNKGLAPKDKKDDSFHRQYSLDRTAAKLTVAFTSFTESGVDQVNGVKKVDSDYAWIFQKFRVKDKSGKVTQISPKVSKQGKIASFVKKSPEVNGSPNERLIQSTSFGSDASHDVKLITSGVAQLKDTLVEMGFTELKSLVIDEPDD
jgi:hypothetical protein